MKVLCVSVILALCAAAASVSAQAIAASYRLNILRQPLDTALKDFAHQTGLQIARFSDTMDGSVMAGPVTGEYSAAQALATLLAPNGLTYRMVNDRTIAVVKLGEASNSESTEPSSAVGSQPGEAARKVDGRTSDGSSKRLLSLAQNDQSIRSTESEGDQAPARNGSSEDRDKTPTPISEIVVTGTHIRGVGVPVGSKVEVIGREEIDRSGFVTVQQVLQSLPQTFQGGANEDTRQRGGASSNFTGGSSVNLRGLGAGSTLVLVNGRRLPTAGVDGSFFDVSSIQMAAIERVEVLPDGASAVYGSDAIAGVVNIILRKDYQGAETRLRYGSVTDGATDEYQFAQLLGTRWSTGNVLASYEFYQRGAVANAARDFAADADLTHFGGDNFRHGYGNPGRILDPDTLQPLYGIPAGQDGTALTPADLIPGPIGFENEFEHQDLLPKQERHSVLASLTQQVTDGFDVFFEGRFAQRDAERRGLPLNAALTVPNTNPFFVDPFGGSASILVGYSFEDDFGPLVVTSAVESYNAVAGGELAVGGDWQIRAYGSYSRERAEQRQDDSVDFTALQTALANPDPAFAFNPFGDGSHTNPATLDAISFDLKFNTISTVRSVNLLADGTLLGLPGGDLKLALGADYRTEDFNTELFTASDATLDHFDRSVYALFGELFVPLVGEANRRIGIAKLALSIAGRFDDYNDFGRTTNPKIGALWSPVDSVELRGTYGTAFKAPSLTVLAQQTRIIPFPLADPASPSGSTTSLVLIGTDPELQEETATIWTLGFDVKPPQIAGLALSATYFNIDYEDRISAPGNVNNILREEERFASIIRRNPSQAEIQVLCNDPNFVANPIICNFLPIGAIVDARTRNTAINNMDGVDFAITYDIDTRSMGRFTERLMGTYLFTFEEAFSASAPVVSLDDTIHNPIALRLRNSLTWSNGRGFAATGFLNYTDGYTDDISVPSRKIDSWTTLDLTLAYETGNRLRSIGFDHTSVILSVLNATDSDPPFVNNSIGFGYDPENADPLGRFISASIIKRW